MDHYSIKYTKSSFDDLRGIFYYVSFINIELENAKKLIKTIKVKIDELSFFPHRYQALDNYPNLRKMVIKNHIVIYKIDDENKVVFIIRIIHSHKNISNLASGKEDE